MEKRKKSRKEKSIETKNKIIMSADELFKNNRFETVSVDSIVKKAGVAKGTFYIYFDSKDALIAELLVDNIKKIDIGYESHLKSLPSDMDTLDMLISLVEKIADVIDNSIGYDLIKKMYHAHMTHTVKSDAIIDYNRDLYKIFKTVIDRGLDQGEFKIDMTSEEFSKHCIMILRGITYEWCVRYPNLDLKYNYVKHFQLLIEGIKKR